MPQPRRGRPDIEQTREAMRRHDEAMAHDD